MAISFLEDLSIYTPSFIHNFYVYTYYLKRKEVK